VVSNCLSVEFLWVPQTSRCQQMGKQEHSDDPLKWCRLLVASKIRQLLYT